MIDFERLVRKHEDNVSKVERLKWTDPNNADRRADADHTLNHSRLKLMFVMQLLGGKE